MLDLGASINVMRYSICNSLNLGRIEETNIIIQLTNRYNAYSKGLLKMSLWMLMNWSFQLISISLK